MSTRIAFGLLVFLTCAQAARHKRQDNFEAVAEEDPAAGFVEDAGTEALNVSANFQTLAGGWRNWKPTKYELDFRLEVMKARNVQGGITCPNGKNYPKTAQDLVWDCNLFRIARNWSLYLDGTPVQPAAHNHGGSTFTQRENEAGYKQFLVYENIAGGGTHSPELIAGRFLRSRDGHCDNMGRSRANRIGIGFSGKNHKVTTMVIGVDATPDRGCLR
jgi:hypothetical protein